MCHFNVDVNKIWCLCERFSSKVETDYSLNCKCSHSLFWDSHILYQKGAWISTKIEDNSRDEWIWSFRAQISRVWTPLHHLPINLKEIQLYTFEFRNRIEQQNLHWVHSFECFAMKNKKKSSRLNSAKMCVILISWWYAKFDLSPLNINKPANLPTDYDSLHSEEILLALMGVIDSCERL